MSAADMILTMWHGNTLLLITFVSQVNFNNLWCFHIEKWYEDSFSCFLKYKSILYIEHPNTGTTESVIHTHYDAMYNDFQNRVFKFMPCFPSVLCWSYIIILQTWSNLMTTSGHLFCKEGQSCWTSYFSYVFQLNSYILLVGEISPHAPNRMKITALISSDECYYGKMLTWKKIREE